MLDSWEQHSNRQEQIKNIKNNRPHPKDSGSGRADRSRLPQKAATGWAVIWV
jgi:hypothetical protein